MYSLVYAYLATLPCGRVVTYGQIAAAIGSPGAAQAVGNALHANPDGNRYPCYRVVDAKGRLSLHYAFGGMEEQARRLEAEGIEVIRKGKRWRVVLSQYGVTEA